MKYRVQWQGESRNELGRLWLAADSPNRQAITRASDAIDAELARDPYRFSESRNEGYRVMIAVPLGVTFRVDEGDQTVNVVRIWQIKPKRP